jgi:8-hydroxy-5-deazaflavin:NADPH oxidoreductase
MAMKIAIIGKGNVGQALAEGLQRGGHEIRFGSQDPKQPVAEMAKWGEVVIMAVPWGALADIALAAGEALSGKTVIDVSNVLTPSYELAIGCTTSGAEELQKQLPKAHVVKAFNTVFAQNMRTGQVHGEKLTVFLAGDHAESKQIVSKLAAEIGFDVVDAGPLKSARYLEPLGVLNITLGYGLKMGTDIGTKLIRKNS